MAEYLGTEGTRPYAGAGWYYAEYRQRVSTAFVAMLAEQLGWTSRDRILDLGAGPGQLSLLVAPLVAEVVAIEPEPDMLAEGERRAKAQGVNNVRFVLASSDDLPTLGPSLGRFRSALMGQSFHWMIEKDRVLRDLSAMIDQTDGSVGFIVPWRVAVPDALETAEKTIQTILKRYLADVPPGPHPNGRHDPFDAILTRSAFPRVEVIEHLYQAPVRPTVEALVGSEYSMSHVLTRLGDRRAEFERDVRATLANLDELGEVRVGWRDEALIGRR
ncbi:MAG TPA: class I SAM-dependent methyltransferase [Chloroflexota bacterium]|nr:class I SAM-dependent methyltransferase [Chloroflexota bacterium]